jgi:hypothetical protein
MLAHSAQAASGGTLQAGVVERHYRELSAQNELRPQDVMRMLVHYHAYGDAAKVPGLMAEHSGRIHKQIDLREEDEIGRLQAEYQAHADKLARLNTEIAPHGLSGTMPRQRAKRRLPRQRSRSWKSRARNWRRS